jgi:D-alanyl-D-alanine dipeptidase
MMMAVMIDLVSNTPNAVAQPPAIPSGFVYLRDVDPGILQDVRYAGPNNFTGKPVPGYKAAECILLLPVAQALKRVQADLAAQKLSLKVYDCYRPQRAVQAFLQWAGDGNDDALSRRFHPLLNKSELFVERYISAASGHSRGNAVDLTLVQLPAKPQAAFDPQRSYGPCTGPIEERAPDNSVDMGTSFDCFDPRSRTASPEISVQQRRWRMTLVSAMERHNFKNYAGEWWHFTYQMPDDAALQSYDFPISPR